LRIDFNASIFRVSTALRTQPIQARVRASYSVGAVMKLFRSSSPATHLFLVVAIFLASVVATTSAYAQTASVTLSWSAPAANSTISGRTQLSFTGRAFKNVEVFRNGQFLARATLTDATHAVVSIDTAQFANGPLTLNAHAWNSPAGTSFTSEADAGSRSFTVNNTVAVSLKWSSPAPNTSIWGQTSFRLTGTGFKNVELFNNGRMISRATVSANSTVAIAAVDVSQLPNGPFTLTAHAWNSPAGQPFTSDADAGALTVVVNNPVVTSKALLGAYGGNDVAAIQQFESWLGRRVDGILGYTGNASWADYDGSVGWATGLWSAIDRPVFWSVPLIPTGATLEEAAKGTYNDHYLKAAQTLAKYRPQDPILYIRTGWEFNGDWFPWTTHGGKSAAFAGAFQQFVKTFRSVSSRFKFEWNVNVGDVGANPEEAYPGDAFVDIVGMGFYWNTDWDPADPVDAWNSMLNRKWGLAWHQQFAAAHGKPTAYSEWGIRSSAGAPYVVRAQAWFSSHQVIYQTYWNSNNAFPGKLSDGQYGAAGEQYRNSFK
jgi:hypothetical protein